MRANVKILVLRRHLAVVAHPSLLFEIVIITVISTHVNTNTSKIHMVKVNLSEVHLRLRGAAHHRASLVTCRAGLLVERPLSSRGASSAVSWSVLRRFVERPLSFRGASCVVSWSVLCCFVERPHRGS